MSRFIQQPNVILSLMVVKALIYKLNGKIQVAYPTRPSNFEGKYPKV